MTLHTLMLAHSDASLENLWNISDAIAAAPFLSRKKVRKNKLKPVAREGTQKGTEIFGRERKRRR